MSIDEKILFEMEAIKTKNNDARQIRVRSSLRNADERILFEMELIKTLHSSPQRGELRKRRDRLRQLFAHLAARLLFKRRNRSDDQIRESQDPKKRASGKERCRPSTKLTIEKKRTYTKEPANLDAINKSASIQAFVPSTKLYKSFHDSDIDWDSYKGNRHCRDEETTEQEMSQSTTSSRHKYASFDAEEPVMEQQSHWTLTSLYSYRDSQFVSRGDLSICPSMSSIGGSSIISDCTINRWLNGNDGGLTSEF
jgi:hypothetical protein